MEKSRVYAIFAVTFAVVAWGASLIATKVALRDVSPVTVVWLRFLMGVLILGMAVVWRRQIAIPKLRELGYFAILGFLGITFHQWLQSTGLLTAQASTTAWIVATTPIFIALLGWIALKEKLGWLQGVGIILAAMGVFWVVSEGDLTALAEGSFGTLGDFLILISAVNWAVFSVISRRGLQRYPTAMMMFYVMLFGWIFSSGLFFAGPGVGEIGLLTTTGWLGILFLGVACSGLAYIFWYDALAVLPAAQAGAFLYIEPIVAVVVAAIILGEAVTIASILGGAAILLGIWMVNRNI
jgi:drug/metabolite transporter (DMT)-like permease